MNKVEIDVFLEFSCFFDDPMDVGNLISGSSASSKSRLYFGKFSLYVLLKPSLTDFEHMKLAQLHGSLNILWYCLSLE